MIAGSSVFLLRESAKWQHEHNALQHPNHPKESIFLNKYIKDLVIGSLIFGTMLIGIWAIFSWIPTWIQSIITGSDGQKERGISMMMLGMGGLTGGFVSGWLINIIGMRKSMLLCFSVCAVLSFVLFKTNAAFSGYVYLEIAIMAFFLV